MHKAPERFVHGYVAPGFEPVRQQFTDNFRTKSETGAALTIYYKNEKVVDIWGGYMDKKGTREWTENSLCLYFSATKGVAALCLAKLHNDGLLDYDQKVSTYWPAFAQNGKEHITVRQLLAHQAGLCLLDKKIPLSRMNDFDYVKSKLECAKPMWEPGSRNGYSAGLLGMYMRELSRLTDAKHRTVGQYLHDELVTPNSIEFYIGIPDTINSKRVATIELAGPVKRLFHLGQLPRAMRKKVINPSSLFMKSLSTIKGYNVNERATWLIEEPSGNGIGTARAVAYLYNLFIDPSNPLHLNDGTKNDLAAPAIVPPGGEADIVMGMDMYYNLGFMKGGKLSKYAVNNEVFGFGGASGSNAFADPTNHLAYCYLPNKMGLSVPDKRDMAIQNVTYKCISASEAANIKK